MPKSIAPTSNAQRVRSGGLLEEQNDVLALEVTMRNARALHIFEVLGVSAGIRISSVEKSSRRRNGRPERLTTHFDSFLGLKGEILP